MSKTYYDLLLWLILNLRSSTQYLRFETGLGPILGEADPGGLGACPQENGESYTPRPPGSASPRLGIKDLLRPIIMVGPGSEEFSRKQKAINWSQLNIYDSKRV
ncbi:hypothetical protein TRICI_001943 [Trichomonascus ciferrii]|uniref:Uncharacterized protein n=1 Tax=Trichomonascus ciferrii TaxID=44093 RepID=A0A642V891_9ASCO|nr:hypothetical protein TRICI_001943 [Trichomonascus ciferrii]